MSRRPKPAPDQATLFDVERTCRLCGRWLRSDRAVRRGYGPTCWRRLQAGQERTADDADGADGKKFPSTDN